MREDKQKPSQKPLMQRRWFWPVIYSSMALLIVAVVFSFNELTKNQKDESSPEQSQVLQDPGLISTSTMEESLKYPFKEEYLSEVSILQNFYDVNAEESKRENALLVFNQVFTTSTGVTIALNSEPFEVVAAMSGTVSEVKMDAFTGNRITIDHPNGIQTRYTSVSDILIKEGDQVSQGEQIATTQENESNPTAGVHLHFEVLEQGNFVNPEKYLSF
jgi:stage II sporulation protein Q